MTTEKQAKAIARRFPIEALAGWLLACDAPENIAKGQRMLDKMGLEDSERAFDYRAYCLTLYATTKAREAHPYIVNARERADIVDGHNRDDLGESPDY